MATAVCYLVTLALTSSLQEINCFLAAYITFGGCKLAAKNSRIFLAASKNCKK
jgi:hypothetical protein